MENVGNTSLVNLTQHSDEEQYIFNTPNSLSPTESSTMESLPVGYVFSSPCSYSPTCTPDLQKDGVENSTQSRTDLEQTQEEASNMEAKHFLANAFPNMSTVNIIFNAENRRNLHRHEPEIKKQPITDCTQKTSHPAPGIKSKEPLSPILVRQMNSEVYTGKVASDNKSQDTQVLDIPQTPRKKSRKCTVPPEKYDLCQKAVKPNSTSTHVLPARGGGCKSLVVRRKRRKNRISSHPKAI
jgi:hypothetical protein